MLHTILCDTLGIEHPIINAPMGDRAASAELAAAVSAAGGFGMIGGSDSRGGWIRATGCAIRFEQLESEPTTPSV